VAVTDADGRSQRLVWWTCGVAVFVLALATFLPIRNHAWLNYDDNVYITQSAPVLAGWTVESVVWAFTSFDGANWFPLTRLSWMLDSELHGSRAAGFLWTNLLLHALASFALFDALARLTRNTWRSAFVAAVFAVHPLHVESVAWIAARKDPLSALFFALALGIYARDRERGGTSVGRLGVLGCAALGLMAKPVLVTLPFVLLLLDFWPLRRLGQAAAPGRLDASKVRAAIVEKWPLFALVAAFSVLTLVAQSSGGTVASLDELAPLNRVGNAIASYVAYLGKSLWPSGLAVFYPHSGAELSGLRVGLSALLLLILTAAAWSQRVDRPYLAVGWLWYLGMLVPVIGLVQVGSQSMADRYTYLPLIGLAIAAAWAVPDLCARLPGRRIAVPLLAASGLALLTITTSLQLRHWRDSEALFRHALAVTERNHVAHSYLGAALLEQGRTAEAIQEFEQALMLRDDLLTVSNNLAWVLATTPNAALRQPLRAIAAGENAARLTGDADPAVLDTLAAAYASAGRFDDAVRTLERAIAISREHGDTASVREFTGRLASYRARRPYVDSPL
jgi:tetratricopeptide (TPR) repeat protein